ncbi:AEC family transporter [soil metagenome]
MDALTTALNAILPTFMLIALGGLADKFFPDLHMETLARLSVQVLIPALIFNALVSTDLTLASALRLSAAYGVYLLGLAVVVLLGSRSLRRDQIMGVMVTTLFGNTGNMGLPITLFAYGQAGFERAVVLLVVSLTAMFVAGPTLLAGGTVKIGLRLREAFKLPPIWATLAGLLVNVLPLTLPLSVSRGVALLANAAIPVMLLSLGLQMRRSWVWELGPAALRTTAFRLGLGPFIAYGAAKLLGLEPLDLKVLVLSAAMPAAVTMFVVAVELKGDYKGVARSVVATTLGSLLAIAAVLFAFP